MAQRTMLTVGALAMASVVGGCSAKRADDAAARAGSVNASPTLTGASEVFFGPPRPPPLERPLRILVGGDLLPHRPSLIAPAAIQNRSHSLMRARTPESRAGLSCYSGLVLSCGATLSR